MTTTLTIIALSLLAGGLFAGLLLVLRRPRGRGMSVRTVAGIEDLKAIGVLSVFKAVTKEIVTARDHSLGNLGKRYLEWLITSRKMAMIFEFDIDFQYDLRDPGFTVREEAPGRYRLQMPRCEYVVHIRNVTFYDEQGGKLLPIIIPDVINKILGGGFNEEDRNKLMDEAREQAEKLAQNLVLRLNSEVQSSARQTMEMLAKSFGAQQVAVDFSNAEPRKTQLVDSAAVR
ncbi:MAG TPA: DUF4230 domain-containing protein [Kiritimatiellia bacterium]|jgi:hypothetical protein|nr:MAG: hypothetical protein BWX54_01216 [Verrucomicrobia bacterium ADurb.Bin018]HOE00630.1 DUF4230 domain-containing protein [Kiritimatiellia bacterium]HOE36005.1 DUF4230 domain-containing protein [Kiritimatiellia bacterium]HOR73319.1 DUF4230 domain-containing protein [Kiritimatiellia bacterium]HOU58224.1 DUF4230 domain-containing protein [Kiritimatiellia bacterium]